MIDTRKIDASDLFTTLRDFHCVRMRRAWRNRSPVTQAQWYRRAATLLPTAASGEDTQHLAAALYVACGELCKPPDIFVPEYMDWPQLAALLPGVVKYQPEKMLSQGEHDARHQAIGSKL
jgi:hypothetical protein